MKSFIVPLLLLCQLTTSLVNLDKTGELKNYAAVKICLDKDCNDCPGDPAVMPVPICHYFEDVKRSMAVFCPGNGEYLYIFENCSSTCYCEPDMSTIPADLGCHQGIISICWTEDNIIKS